MLGFNTLGSAPLGSSDAFVPGPVALRKSVFDPWADNNVSGASDLWDNGLAGNLLTRDYFDQAPAVTVTGMAHFQTTTTGTGTSYTSPELQFGAGLNLMYLRFNGGVMHINSITVNGVAAQRLVAEPPSGDTSEIWGVVLTKAIRSTFVTNHSGNANVGEVIIANVKGVNVTPTYVSNSKPFNAYISPMTSEVVTCPAGGVIIAMGAIQGGFNAATAPSAFIYGPIKATGENSSYVATRTTTGTFELTGGGNGFASIAMIAFAPETVETPLVLVSKLNGSDKSSNIVLSNSDLTFTTTNTTASRYAAVRANIGKASGKWYFEGTAVAVGNVGFGVANKNALLHEPLGNTAPGSSAYQSTGFVGYNGTNANVTAFAAGDKIGCAIDATLGLVWYSVNGVWVFAGNPVAGTNPFPLGGTGPYFPVGTTELSSDVGTINFGATKFTYPAPTGFSRFQEQETGTITWDPADKTSQIVLSEGNLRAGNPAAFGGHHGVRATRGKTQGKWYYEFLFSADTTLDANVDFGFGVGNQSANLTNFLGIDGNSVAQKSSGYAAYNNVGQGNPAYAIGDIGAIAFDAANGHVWFSKNGVWSGNPVTATGGFSTPTIGTYYPVYTGRNNSDNGKANFGATAFAYQEPTGFTRLEPLATSSGLSAPYGLATEVDLASAVGSQLFKAIGLSTETDLAQGLQGRIIAAMGMATEADQAFALAAVVKRAMGLATETDFASNLSAIVMRPISFSGETDTAFPLTTVDRANVGLASETDTASALGAFIRKPVGLAAETDAALALGSVVKNAAGLATETDAAQAMPATTKRDTGLATETDTAQAAPAFIRKPVGVATETDAALALGATVKKDAGLAAETDVAQALPGTVRQGVGLSTETDAALALSARAGNDVGLATESDLAFALAGIVRRVVGLSTETDQATALGSKASRPIGMAGETNTALGLTGFIRKPIGFAGETDTATAQPGVTKQSIGLAAETDAAFALASMLKQSFGTASETDQASAIAMTMRRNFGIAVTTDQALGLAAVLRRDIGRADEIDAALAPLPVKYGAIGMAGETDTGFALLARLLRATGLAGETDNAQALPGLVKRAFGAATEADIAAQLIGLVRREIGLASEMDEAFGFSNRDPNRRAPVRRQGVALGSSNQAAAMAESNVANATAASRKALG